MARRLLVIMVPVGGLKSFSGLLGVSGEWLVGCWFLRSWSVTQSFEAVVLRLFLGLLAVLGERLAGCWLLWFRLATR